jgi:Vault protein inter-alpha-trypsin domain/Uncharacterized protein conserved in bacteria (DUF2135)
MLKQLFICAAFFGSLNLVKAQQPVLTIANKDSALVTFNQLKVQVKVIANIAFTTTEIEICSKAKIPLEGELKFPLPEGATVNHFALDINGTLRNAVPVPQQQAQVVFENTIKKRVDPALLEKTIDNSYRTRIYPIPANGCRRVVIGYQQILPMLDASAVNYVLPFNVTHNIGTFSFKIAVYSNTMPEVQADCNNNLQFTTRKNVFETEFTKSNYAPKGSFAFIMPKIAQQEEVLTQQANGQNYFLINHYPQVTALQKVFSTNTQIIWDNSLSNASNNHSNELQFIQAYVQKMQNGVIQLNTFNIYQAPTKFFVVRSGQCPDLIAYLSNLVYDGATNFNAISPANNATEHLLFTDGISTWGGIQNTITAQNPVYTITEAATANYEALHNIATNTGGLFLNLNQLPVNIAINKIAQPTLQLINVLAGSGVVANYQKNSTVIGNVLLTGTCTNQSATIQLQYGYNNKVVTTQNIILNPATQNVTEVSLAYIWAQQAINIFNQNYTQNKDTIIALGKQFNIVTQNTTLLVLDDVADYAKYKIEPPAELKQAYDSLLATQQQDQQQQNNNIMANAISTIQTLKNWWQTDYSPRATLTFLNGNTKKALANKTIQFNNQSYTTNSNGQATVALVFNQNKYSLQMHGYKAGVIALPKNINDQINVLLFTNSQAIVNNNNYDDAPKKIKFPSMPEIRQAQFTPPQIVADEEVRRDVSASATPVSANSGAFNLEAAKANGTPGATTNFTVITGRVPGLNITNRAKETTTNNPTVTLQQIPNNSPFIQTLKNTSANNLYQTYLQLRTKYQSTPSFYIQVAQYFYAQNLPDTALLIASNVADIALTDHETLKMLGYELQRQNQFAAAKNIFYTILMQRPQEPQSHRDYALALQDAGLYQNALDTLYATLTNTYDGDLLSDYQGIEETILLEINALIAAHPNLNTTKIDTNLIANLPVDVRIVLNWNSGNSDMDLWVTDPLNEKCYYQNSTTKCGGRISNDFTSGYGPEQFLLKVAPKGNYKIQLHYYGDAIQKLSGGTTVVAQLYTNYGRPNQVKKIISLQLNKNATEGVLVGQLNFN